MENNKSLIVTDRQVRRFITLEEVIESVENTWRWHGDGKVILPPKVTTDMQSAGVDGWFNSMPSYVTPHDMAGIKVVGGYKNNPSRGMPYIRSNLLLTDPRSGALRALMCGDWISDARTGAQPAVAAKYLASRTDTVAIIGAGLQAYYSLMCMSRMLCIKEVRVRDIRPETVKLFMKRFPDAPFILVPSESNEQACRGADVIITVTTANEVLVEEPWCKPGCLVLTMGSYTEVSDEIARKFDKIFVDSISQGLHRGNFKEMADRGLITASSFAAEIPEVVAGKKPGRSTPGERIIAALIGMGSLDLSVAAIVYKRVLSSGGDVLAVNMMG